MPKKARYEYKYLIPVEKFESVRRTILPFVIKDKFAEVMPDDAYTVRSIYYDTMNLEAYFEKIEGIRKRKKVRIRGYNELSDDSIVFAEIKRKYENKIIKNRAMFDYKNINEYLATGRINNLILSDNPSMKRDAERFYYNIKVKSLRPVILITYERAAYTGAMNKDLRITFDYNLRSKLMPSMKDLFEEKGLMPALRDFVILEIKFQDVIPHWVNSITNHFHLQRLSVSKYTICLDSHKLFSGFRKELSFTTGISVFN